MRDFQQELSDDINEVDLRINDDFGANIGYSIGIKVEEINTQFFASYNSTGGKSSYSDYSGTVRLTQLLKAYTVGAEYQFKLSKENSKTMFYFGTRGFFNYSHLDLESYSKISDNVSRESIDFNSIDIGVGFRFIYDIPISIAKLRLNMGYDLVMGGDLKFKDNRDYSLEDDQGDRVRTGWSGFRSGIGIVIPL
ncbi:hypothetical protein RBH94_10335 [Aestuariibaculum sp. YM273]|uniref:hypothetical protein n=1 Tax=Aestuariibaculum sp. YM273 TaxID=3070659 RepID=UPI0027DB5B22|nr:hypothetical protein [Aestuariibaculum sp. YM273]WMI64458.1 hypothetical protein RBH94_10335 [Aestuariibaculum sp. YM273]